jgi:hypothetical protein
MNDRELITGLDACRAESSDLREPGLRAVADAVESDARAAEIRVRIGRIDAATLRAMHNVSLPPEVESRLVNRMCEELRQAPSVGSGFNTLPDPATTDSLAARRRWLAWSAGVAATTAALIAVVMFLRPPPPFEKNDLASSRQWHGQVVTSNDWQALAPNDIDPQLLSKLHVLPRRYRDASSIVGRDAHAYDLSWPGGPQATLFVIPQATRAGLPASPPPRPDSFTLGSSVAFWQQGDLIYVVVVDSERIDDYRRLVKTTPPATA